MINSNMMRNIRYLTSHLRWYSNDTSKFIATCKSVKQLERIGAIMAAKSAVGDVLLLRGSIGVGKSCFCRGYIRELIGDPKLLVTSPTYLLDNTYANSNNEIM